MKTLLKTTIEVCVWIIFSFLVAILGFLALSARTSDIPFKGFLIQSGSMEPSIMTGDVIIVKEFSDYGLSDVITFYDSANRVVTHRVIEVDDSSTKEAYKTKGDANQSEDLHLQPIDKVIGKVVLVIPKLGFLAAFSQSKMGIFLLILVPVVLIVYDEIIKMFKEVRKQ